MSLFKKLEISISVALVISFVLSIIAFAQTSKVIRNNVIRLHVIANSDSDDDQHLKLIVRDKILVSGDEIFDGSVNVDNAIDKIYPQLENLKNIAKQTINQYGYKYDVRITMEREYFSTRTYNTITLPAGEYLALKVIIGEGTGQNWWCVMFPPMCLSAADENAVLNDVLDKKSVKLLNKNPKFELRFKFIELFEEVKQTFNK